jgi:hypothetical protein
MIFLLNLAIALFKTGNKIMLKAQNLSDKELLGYILGSFEYIRQYLKDYSEDKFENDLKTQDAVCHRMYKISIAAKLLSVKIRNRHPNFPWYFYTIWDNEPNAEEIWDLFKEPQKENSDFDTLLDLFVELEIIYFKEYPKKIKSRQSKIKETQLSRDNRYPIKTSRSIWTVKNK